MRILKYLNYEELRESKGRIACPFADLYDGPVTRLQMNKARGQREETCASYCGKLYPKMYQEDRCPCWGSHRTRVYVRKRFWQQLEKARKGDQDAKSD